MFDEPKNIVEVMTNYFYTYDDEYGLRERMLELVKHVKGFEPMLHLLLMEFPITSDYVRNFISYVRYNWFRKQYGAEYVIAMNKQYKVPHANDYELMSNLGEIGTDNVYFRQALKNCAERDGGRIPYGFSFVPRWQAEYNTSYIHLVVGGLIHTRDDKYVVLRRKYGVFNNKLTLVQGHCNYTSTMGSLMYYPIDQLPREHFILALTTNLNRELNEEVSLSGISKPSLIDEPVLFRAPTFVTPGEISYYHAGFLFHVEVDADSSTIRSQEPDRNQVEVMSLQELISLKRSDTDNWLKDYVDFAFK